MASVVLDITSTGLDNAFQNVRDTPHILTAGVAQLMVEWYNKHYKKTVLEIIDTGEGVSKNVGRYADYKSTTLGISHGLGKITHNLYFSVSMKQPTIKETKGMEVRFSIKYNDPYYIAYVIEGTSRHIGRDFVTLAKDKEWQKLIKMIGTMFDDKDLTFPSPQFRSSVIGPHVSTSLRSFG